MVSFPFPKGKNTRLDAELTKQIVMALMADKYDYLFSFNYFPVAAMAAKACRIKYLSWVYDSPYIQLYSETIHYETNDIRIFDRAEVLKLQSLGIHTVSYLPMAADTDYYDTFLPQAGAQYQAEISFVGSMYTEPKQQLYTRLESLPAYDKGYLEGIMQAQKEIYGQQILEGLLPPSLVAAMEQAAPLQEHPDGFAKKGWVYANYYLYRKVTAMERTDIIKLMAERFDLRVYTYGKQEGFAEKVFQKPVDYYKQAPYVYKNSKINLNITLRSIGSGIPLRAFDIMGCGGFLLTNYQADFLEYFEPDVDFVYYTDYQDLLEKVAYYISHEEERRIIAQNGYNKVKKLHTYKKRILTFWEKER